MLAEIAVWSDKNVCPAGKVSQSSTSGDQVAELAQTPVPVSGNIDRVLEYAATDIQDDPSWTIDFGDEGIPIKELLVIGVTDDKNDFSKGLKVHVGDHVNFKGNPSCTKNTFDAHRGAEVSCRLKGRYVTIWRPGNNL